MNETSPLDFNFWPSFADSMLAIVFIMVLLFVLVMQGAGVQVQKQERAATQVDSLQKIVEERDQSLTRIREEVRDRTVEITEIRQRQDRIRERIGSVSWARIQQREPVPDGRQMSEGPHYVVYDQDGRRMVNIYYDIQLQRLTFSGNILFDPNRYDLSQEGEQLLRAVGAAIDDELNSIQRIQIEGHTDDRPTQQYRGGNLELGALRAITVYRFFTQHPRLEFDPQRHSMSVTSFGQHLPVASNARAETRALNRRIEILLFFRKGSFQSQ